MCHFSAFVYSPDRGTPTSLMLQAAGLTELVILPNEVGIEKVAVNGLLRASIYKVREDACVSCIMLGKAGGRSGRICTHLRSA